MTGGAERERERERELFGSGSGSGGAGNGFTGFTNLHTIVDLDCFQRGRSETHQFDESPHTATILQRSFS